MKIWFMFDNHVVALATSDGGDGDRIFARDYGRKFRIERMKQTKLIWFPQTMVI